MYYYRYLGIHTGSTECLVVRLGWTSGGLVERPRGDWLISAQGCSVLSGAT